MKVSFRAAGGSEDAWLEPDHISQRYGAFRAVCSISIAVDNSRRIFGRMPGKLLVFRSSFLSPHQFAQ